ncbi:dienelactone hydrolase [Ramlibacter tataouinensis]|uniref:Dienelactone hydrolase n=2 Tax=Ramlibacter tataouinensis TaxID=94132 RepID=A0A127JPR8_9BURK|nr:dienelactone hydrolase [Ramlibacter tataouinensis]
MLRHCLTTLLALAATWAQANVGLTQLKPVGADGPVTVFYPTAAPEQSVKRGPFELKLAPDAPPARGNGRLVVISHGSGGNAWVHSDLARALVNAGFVVALPRHQGDNAQDPSTPGPESWKIRPAEVSRAIDAVAADPRFAAIVSFEQVGMYGMSAGGHTALTLAGGRWSPGQFRRHCEADIANDFASCVGLATRLRGDFLDDLKKGLALNVIRHRFDDDTWYVHTDPRIRVIVAGVPFAADFDAASLATPQVPLGLVTAGRDKWLVPRFHSDAILAACAPRCELVAHLPAAGHGALLSPPPPPHVLGEIAQDLLGDPPGFDRSVLPEVDARIVAFMRRHLLP